MRDAVILGTSVLCAVLLLSPQRAEAQDLTLHIRDGRVALDARGVSVRQILSVWARVGGVTIVNEDKTSMAPVTLTLTDVPEETALEVLLRGVSGYILVPRAEGRGASVIDRIVILPTSSMAASPARAAVPINRPQFPLAPQSPASAAGSGDPMFVPPAVAAVLNGGTAIELRDGEEDSADAPAPAGAIAGGPSPAVPVPPRPISYVSETPAVVPAVAPTAPGNPFGVPHGSGQPGVVTPVPTPAPTVRILTESRQPPTSSSASERSQSETVR